MFFLSHLFWCWETVQTLVALHYASCDHLYRQGARDRDWRTQKIARYCNDQESAKPLFAAHQPRSFRISNFTHFRPSHRPDSPRPDHKCLHHTTMPRRLYDASPRLPAERLSAGPSMLTKLHKKPPSARAHHSAGLQYRKAETVDAPG